MASDYVYAHELEELTGLPGSTFRYWANLDPPLGPPSFKLGRRRVWRRDAVVRWLAEQESPATA